MSTSRRAERLSAAMSAAELELLCNALWQYLSRFDESDYGGRTSPSSPRWTFLEDVEAAYKTAAAKEAAYWAAKRAEFLEV